MSRSPWRYVLPIAVVGGGIAMCARSRVAPGMATTEATETGPPRPDAENPALEGLALLDGLRTGDVLGEWTVERIIMTKSPTDQPQLTIELGRKGSGITVWVGRKETVSDAPVMTERYGVRFGHARPYGEEIPPDAYDAMTAAIAERVRRQERSAPLPPGL